jgi:flagellar M-ring protein FliF
MQELLQQISAAWNALALRQRVTLLATTALTVAAVGAIVYWAQQPTWGVLYTGLDPRDAQPVVQELQSRKVPVRIAAGGGSVEVPLEQVDALRMQMAVQGLPESGKFGFLEMFSGDSIAQSSQVQKIRYQKALEDELARTIEALDEVRSARVHLVLPGARVFVDDKSVAKASVTVGLRAGSALAVEKVQAIARIVAGAVPELSLEQVNVLDTQGHVLWEGDGDGSAVAGSRQIELRAAIERDVNGKVGRVLEPLVGADGFVVKTTAELDFQKVLRREKSYDPDSGVLLTEERTREKQASPDAAAGAPGTASHSSSGPGGEADADGVLERQNHRTSYEYSVSESSIEQPVGQLQRLSVAVLVDQRRTEVAGVEGTERTATARSDEELAKIEDLVKGAIGFDAQRGDRVTVEQVAFQRPPVETAAGGFDVRPWLPLVKWPTLVALALMAFFLLVRPLLATLRQAAAGRHDILSVPVASGTPAAPAALPLGKPSPVELMRQRLALVAAEQPEGMAQTLRIWLHQSQVEKKP